MAAAASAAVAPCQQRRRREHEEPGGGVNVGQAASRYRAIVSHLRSRADRGRRHVDRIVTRAWGGSGARQ